MCERGFEQELVLGINTHSFHQLRHVIDVKHIDYVSPETAARNSRNIAFKIGTFRGNLLQA